MIVARFILVLKLLVTAISAHCQGILLDEIQHLNFGDFYLQPGPGTITVTHEGSLGTTGSVHSLGTGFSPAVFDITTASQENVMITFPTDLVVQRSGGSETLQVVLGPTNVDPSFNIYPSPTLNRIVVGATLQIPAGGTPSGNYSGTYEIELTVINE